MRMVAPDGPVYQAGTLAGNPLATAAGIACLTHLRDHPELYDHLEAMGGRVEHELNSVLTSSGISGCVQRVGAMMTLFLGPTEVRSWEDASTVDRKRFARFFHESYRNGVLLPPSPFEAWFLMQDHGGVLDRAIAGLAKALEA